MCRPARMMRGQVVAVVDPAGVGRRAGVADQQRAGVAVGERLLLAGRLVDGAVRVEPDVAVRVDQPGQHPAGDGLVAAAGGAVVGDPAVDHPELVPDVVGPDEHRPGEVEDVAHGRNLRDRVAAGIRSLIAMAAPRPELPLDPDRPPPHLTLAGVGLVFLGGVLGTAARYGVGEAVGPWGPWRAAASWRRVVGAFLLGVAVGRPWRVAGRMSVCGNDFDCLGGAGFLGRVH